VNNAVDERGTIFVVSWRGGDVTSLGEAAPADIRPVLELMYQEGAGVAEAARAAGMSRFAFRRRLDHFADQHREFAA